MDAFWPESWGDFLLVTVILGGGAAYLVGRAVALTWRPLPTLVGYLLLLDCAVRFIHFALFGGMLLAPASFLLDLALLLAAGGLGYRVTRAAQIVRQYPWLYRPTGPLTWNRRNQNTGS